jgi:hypothetical protein
VLGRYPRSGSLAFLVPGGARPGYHDIFSAVVRRGGIGRRTWSPLLRLNAGLWFPASSCGAACIPQPLFGVVGEGSFDRGPPLAALARRRRRLGQLQTLLCLPQTRLQGLELLGMGRDFLLSGESQQGCRVADRRSSYFWWTFLSRVSSPPSILKRSSSSDMKFWAMVLWSMVRQVGARGGDWQALTTAGGFWAPSRGQGPPSLIFAR